ncbi:hypothetical protein P167DRAFT_542923 [Morchella conica CCBAS932]|uniref:Uncharacterized protein n=1 Tax=Morchella conica CCBAS932 TaxID=1392247 RepID=A0A3N4KXU0_9PEZI|nr:hypothetical protein P167DRAFT_542923 [Morchella conica CCBAS932]
MVMRQIAKGTRFGIYCVYASSRHCAVKELIREFLYPQKLQHRSYVVEVPMPRDQLQYSVHMAIMILWYDGILYAAYRFNYYSMPEIVFRPHSTQAMKGGSVWIRRDVVHLLSSLFISKTNQKSNRNVTQTGARAVNFALEQAIFNAGCSKPQVSLPHERLVDWNEQA